MSEFFPDPNTVFPNEYKTSCFIKNIVKAPNVFIGDYTYYDDPYGPLDFEKKNILKIPRKMKSFLRLIKRSIFNGDK